MSRAWFLVNQTRTFIALRLVMAMAICAMSMPALATSGGTAQALLGGYLLSNLAPLMRPTSSLVARIPIPILFLLDLGTIVWVMLLTGEVRSEFYVVFFLIILMTAIGRSVRSVIAITFVSVVLYAFMTSARNPDVLVSREFTTRIALFFVTALFSAHLAEMVSTERQKHHFFRSHYRSLFDESPHGILVAGIDGTVLEANPPARRLLGEEPVGMKLEAVFRLRPPSLGLSKASATSGVDTGTLFRGEAVFQIDIHRDGEPGPCEVTLRRFDVEAARYLLVFLQDLRDTNRMRERIAQLEKTSLLGNLVRSITHEINNPLTAVMGHAELIQMEDAGETVRQSAAAILESGRRCRQVIESMLRQFQRTSPSLTSIALSELVHSVAKQMEFHLRYHLVRITFALDDALVVSGDAQQLDQVLVNLMCNAVYAMHDRPVRVLGLRTYDAGDSAAIEVSDTGTGMPPDVLRRLFQPGFTTKPAGVGHGLGLAICQEMIQRQEGRMTVSSREGHGTTFTLHLPKGAGAPSAAEPAGAPSPTPGPSADGP